MSRPVQELLRRWSHILAALVLGVLAAGCAGKMSAASLGIDDSIRTGSIQRDPEPADPVEDADARTIRHAVTSADLRALERGSIAWANRETGSSGNIVEIDEVSAEAGPCRRFVASRQNFEGILLYRGEACLLGDGRWRLMRFEAFGA